MNPIIKAKGINFGIIYGLFLISLTLYAYVIDINFFHKLLVYRITINWLFRERILGYRKFEKRTARIHDF